MKMTTKGQYAIVAINYIKNNSKGSPVRLKEISESEKLSNHYLEQLFRKMREAGIVESVRGPGGGYIMAREKVVNGAKTTYIERETDYLEILEAVGERLSFSDNLSRDSKATKSAIDNLDKLNDLVHAYFKSLKI